jgi:hypothetical protein
MSADGMGLPCPASKRCWPGAPNSETAQTFRSASNDDGKVTRWVMNRRAHHGLA